MVNGRTSDRVDEAVAGAWDGPTSSVSPPTWPAPRVRPTLLRRAADVDILVNNLGIFGAVPAREITDEQWRTYFEVNVLAAARLIRDVSARR